MYWQNCFLYVVPFGCNGSFENTFNQLEKELRKLWGEHIAWIRMTITSLVLDLPDAKFVVNRLLRTGTDMGEQLSIYYGEALGKRYADLLQEHISLAGELIEASKAGDLAKAQEINERWYENGEEIAQFLHHINPYISLDEFRTLFNRHLDLSAEQATSMIQGDYKQNVDLYDTMLDEAMRIAELIADGIARQMYRNHSFYSR